MKNLSSNEIRDMYLKFFNKKGHEIIASSSVIPNNDKSLLFNNAGVTPLKSYFDGSSIPNNRRMTSSQKCIRTNDIENVGMTARHQTLFEMLGNFSIGDYFREDAIKFGYEFLTSKKYLDIDVNLLYITYFPTDTETFEIWKSLGIKEENLIPLEYNFWEIGVGPCGPCTEIFYDRGESFDKRGKELIEQDLDNDRFIEIWNIVFSQYNCDPKVSRDEYKELPSKNIDTGMGLERISCISQNALTNFETDIFMPYIKELEKISNVTYDGQFQFKLIVDHARCVITALSDGAVFSNTKAGYILRRLLRRSMKHGKALGLNEPFIYKLVDVYAENFGKIYPNITKNKEEIKESILNEEELFLKTLKHGEERLIELIESNNVNAMEVFKLYDTYGFPFELTIEYLNDNGIDFNIELVNEYVEKQRELSKNASKHVASMNMQNEVIMNLEDNTTFIGYDNYECVTKIVKIIQDDLLVNSTYKNCTVLLEETPFYAESGGQISDTGVIKSKNFNATVVSVYKTAKGQILHDIIVNNGDLTCGEEVYAKIDVERREKIQRNHSSVHLLQYALKKVLGEEVAQAGSKVDDRSLRFDFSYTKKISDDELLMVEDIVNSMIESCIATDIKIMSIEEALKSGSIGLFTDKYGDFVRVVTIGESSELCGGCHVKNTKDIVKFAIASLSNKGANVYRIEGATDTSIQEVLYDSIASGNEIIKNLLIKAEDIIDAAIKFDVDITFDFDIDNNSMKSYRDVVYQRNEVNILKEDVKKLDIDFNNKKREKILEMASNYEENIKKSSNYDYCVINIDELNNGELKLIADFLISKYNNLVVFAYSSSPDKVSFICKTNTNFDALDIIKQTSLLLNGTGGGVKEFAQGSSKDSSNLSKALEFIEEVIGK